MKSSKNISMRYRFAFTARLPVSFTPSIVEDAARCWRSTKLTKFHSLEYCQAPPDEQGEHCFCWNDHQSPDCRGHEDTNLCGHHSTRLRDEIKHAQNLLRSRQINWHWAIPKAWMYKQPQWVAQHLSKDARDELLRQHLARMERLKNPEVIT